MKKVNCKAMLSTLQKGAAKYAPELLLIFGSIAFTTAVVEAWHEGKRAKENIEERKEELGIEEDEKLPAKEVVKSTWKNVVIVAVPVGVGIACMVGAHSINAQRNAALAAAYTLTEDTFNRYKNKVRETVGDKKAEQIDENMARDLVGNDPVTKASVINTGHGTSLFKESLFGQYFLCDRNWIDQCINRYNERMFDEMYGTVNELYSEIGIKSDDYTMPVAGGLLGWDVNKQGIVKHKYHYTSANDGTPCGVLDFYNLPGPTNGDTRRY